jgi:hypothetical protein
MEMNRVTIRDINMPPSADEFTEEFFRCAITLFIDFFFRYDQVELNSLNRDMIAFIIPFRLFRMTILL